MQEDSKTIKQAVEEILNEAFGDKPIPARVAEAAKSGRVTVINRDNWFEDACKK